MIRLRSGAVCDRVKKTTGPGAQTVRRVMAVAGAGVAWQLHRTDRLIVRLFSADRRLTR
jgi:hypothetical protein